MARIIYLTLLIFLVGSCEQEREITLEIPFEGEKMAVFGLISNENSHEIDVYKTTAVSDTTRPIPKNLAVQLYEDDQYLMDYEIFKNKGKIDVEISKKKKYHLEIESELGTFHSEPIELTEKLNIRNFKYQISKDSANIALSFSFIVPNNSCFYNYSIIMYNNGNSYFEKEARFSVSSKCNSSANDKKIIVHTGLFSFPIFDGNIFLGIDIPDKMCIKLYHISNEVVEFYESDRKNGKDWGNQLTNNTPLWGNVNGAYGYFGSYHVDSLVVEF